MEKTVCELFAGIGGFRCGLNHINTLNDLNNNEKWQTVYFNQYEPSGKTQYAYGCYVYNFGKHINFKDNNTFNTNITKVDKSKLPDFNLLVGGFPCQDYSVASTNSKGIEGSKGNLWWSILDTIKIKKPPFILLENVDRLLKSPSKQKGRDFGIMLYGLWKENYIAEWRVVNAAEYGYPQRRKRVFLFAYKENTNYSKRNMGTDVGSYLCSKGFFANTFPIKICNPVLINTSKLPSDFTELFNSFQFDFENTGCMFCGHIFTAPTVSDYYGSYKTLGDVLENKGCAYPPYIVLKEKLYYTDSQITSSNETMSKLSDRDHHTWQYLKGGKKILRTSKNGFQYVYSEGSIPMIDAYDKPSRTLLTSEGSFSRTTHLVKDKITNEIRLLTPIEAERLQGFPDNFTRFALSDNKKIEIPYRKRMFLIGNALVVSLIQDMEVTLSKIVEEE